jgi:PAS domain S-box-containing protein
MSGTRIVAKKKTAASETSAAAEESRVVRALTERVQQLEGALQDADACLRAIMDSMPPRIFFKDRRSNFIAVNQALAGDLGKTPAELVGRNDFDFFPAELATKYQADDQRIMASRQTEKLEEVNQVGEERRVVEVIKTPVTREDGEVIGLMGSFTDITFRRRTEEALDRERDLLRALLESLPDRIYFKDRQSRFVRCSEEFARFCSKPTAAELIGKTDFDLFTEEHARPAFEDEKRIMHSGEPMIGKIEKETWANGRVTWVLTSKLPHRDKTGKVIGTFGISRDITNLKLTEDELKRSQVFMNSVVENLPIMVFIKDAQLRFVLLNRAGEQLTGYPREVFLGKSDLDFYPPEVAETYTARDREALAGGKLVDIPEEPLEARDKGQRILHTRKIPICDEEGRPLYLLGISEDITERKDAEGKVKRFNARLEQHNRELQDFVYVASHDLQEPLRKVQAFGDRLRSRCAEQLGAQGRDYLERVQDAARRMQTLLEDLLTYSRITTRANPFVTVDLNELVREVTEEMEEQIEKCQARLEVDRLAKIEADPVQMRQVLQQLLSNAFKFRRKDIPPHVKISSRIVTGPKAESLERFPVSNFNLTPRNPHCLLSIEDNGIGFDEKYVDRIFVVFQRLHGRGAYEGTGVGLAICRKIVLRHNGEITATSQPNRGSTFLLLLPVKQTQAIPTVEPSWERTTK